MLYNISVVVDGAHAYRVMMSRSTLLLIALAACSSARPSDDNLSNQNQPVTKAPVLGDFAKRNEGPAAAAPQPQLLNMALATNEVTMKPVNERFPHAVLFGRTCGGSIISPTWVITAAHCTLFTSGNSILAGTNNSMHGGGVHIRVKRLVIHPRFSVGPYWLNPETFGIKQVAARFDFLLAELEQPLPIDGKRIAAAELDDDAATLPVGLDVAYAGYGAEQHGETMRHDMHAMELSTLPDKTCASALEQYDPQDMLCAKGRPPRYDSACNGDSGSGLVDNKGRLLGIASWVEKDASKCFQGAIVVFSRVSRVRDWIRQVTGV